MNKMETFIKRLFRYIRDQRGFTLLELVLSIVVGGVIFGIASETLVRQADTYSFIANRKNSIADVRFGMNKISHELLRLETSDIQAISPTGISFLDENGQGASFSLGQDGSSLSVYRGNDALVEDVASIDFEYHNGDGEVIDAVDANIDDVRRIKVTITTEPKGDEGAISISTTVVPRSFIGYANYQ